MFNRPQWYSDFVDKAELYKFSTAGRVMGKTKTIVLDHKSMARAHRYVLLHSEMISDYRRYMMKRNFLAELIALARGPNKVVNRYNGFKFHTKDHDKFRKTHNSGIMVEADGKTYYGALKDIYELDYYGIFKVILFRCDWIDINSSRGLKKDANGFTLVNFTRLIHTGALLKDDPFIFSSQARQVFFVQDAKDKDWATVIKTEPRDLYDMGK